MLFGETALSRSILRHLNFRTQQNERAAVRSEKTIFLHTSKNTVDYSAMLNGVIERILQHDDLDPKLKYMTD